ncbi:MAG: class I SAM-dependent methyltransferase [Simkaniaceae bacterium]|nr:class I SAM-dependent methyltransferase [Simkaniaceae bacterium]
METTYRLIDSGNERKLEQFGPYIIERPCPMALYRPKQSKWIADASFCRQEGWRYQRTLPPSWVVVFRGLKFKISLTDFGHVGLFPEHAMHWDLKAKKGLNLFAYSGGMSLALAQKGGEVCHVDASKPMVSWARENADLNQITTVRWIVDDALKFLKREAKRGVKYDGIVLDPPTFGRGNQGQVFKIERDLPPLLEAVNEVCAKENGWVLLTTHTPGLTNTILGRMLIDALGEGKITGNEMLLEGEVPSGYFARWNANECT